MRERLGAPDKPANVPHEYDHGRSAKRMSPERRGELASRQPGDSMAEPAARAPRKANGLKQAQVDQRGGRWVGHGHGEQPGEPDDGFAGDRPDALRQPPDGAYAIAPGLTWKFVR